jgi:superoxide dismutase, Cu-Zn family
MEQGIFVLPRLSTIKGELTMNNAIRTVTLLAMTAGAAAGAIQVSKGAKAELRDSQGKMVGTAQLKQVNDGVQISVQVMGLPVGTHAFHIHSVGKCEAPDFESAGAHFNPGGKKHGLKNPDGPHAGDMPNLTVGPDGKGKAQVVNTHFTLSEGANSLFQQGGTAIVIHEKADDDRTDPAGNAGGRIACGVIEKAL